MAELADAPDSKSGSRKRVGVRFSLRAPRNSTCYSLCCLVVASGNGITVPQVSRTLEIWGLPAVPKSQPCSALHLSRKVSMRRGVCPSMSVTWFIWANFLAEGENVELVMTHASFAL